MSRITVDNIKINSLNYDKDLFEKGKIIKIYQLLDEDIVYFKKIKNLPNCKKLKYYIKTTKI
jgi:hypothetical protein